MSDLPKIEVLPSAGGRVRIDVLLEEGGGCRVALTPRQAIDAAAEMVAAAKAIMDEEDRNEDRGRA